jgi:copper transport protein
MAAVAAIVVSGGFSAWRQIGSASAVTTTPFGRLVLTKTIIFVVLVAVATRSRRLVHGHLNLPFGLSRPPARPTSTKVAPPVGSAASVSVGPGAMAAPPALGPPPRTRNATQRKADLRKAVWLELGLAGTIIAVAAVLVNAQPARQAINQPFSAEVHAGPSVLVDVVIDPAKAGPVAMHLYTLSSAGAQIDVPEVTATMALASAGVTNLTVPLQHGGTGHFLVSGFQVPLRGTWTVTITVRTTNFDEFVAPPVTVRMR